MPHDQYKSCIDACQECVVACEHCAASCLEEDGVEMMLRCIELDRDCADMCSAAVRFMSRGSEYAGDFCALCAMVCQACGDECAKHEKDHCRKCAEACHACAKSCDAMAAA